MRPPPALVLTGHPHRADDAGARIRQRVAVVDEAGEDAPFAGRHVAAQRLDVAAAFLVDGAQRGEHGVQNVGGMSRFRAAQIRV